MLLMFLPELMYYQQAMLVLRLSNLYCIAHDVRHADVSM